jgi:PEP-CTERM motif
MNRRNFPVQELLLFWIFIGAGASHAAANVKEAVLEVDLKNPGAKISQIQFVIQSMQLTNNIINSISVQTPGVPINSAKNLFKTGSLTFDRQPKIDAVQLTLTPIKVFGPNQNVTFLMTVPGLNSLNILSGTINNNGNILGGAPAWFNNDSPPKQLVPGPTLPGFKVVTKDAAYTIYGDSNQPFGIQNLTFLPNITESQFDALNLDAVIAEEPNASLPDIPLLSSSASFTGLPDPAPGNLFIAVGQILDTSGNVIGAFAEGVQTQGVPEPSTGILLAVGLAGLLAVGWLRRRRDRKGDFTMTASRSSPTANPKRLANPY